MANKNTQKSDLYYPSIMYLLANAGAGTGTHLAYITEHLVQKRWAIEILCTGTKPLTIYKLPVNVIPPKKRYVIYPFSVLRSFYLVLKDVKKIKPDVIHSYFFWSIIFARVLKLLGIVSHIIENREDEWFNLNAFSFFLLKITNKIPDKIICVSNAVRNIVLDKEKLDPKKVCVILNGIDLNRKKIADLNIQAQFSIPQGCFIIGMVACFERSIKGLSYLLNAVPRIIEEIPNIRVLIVGSGDIKKYQAEAKKLNVDEYVIFTGYQNEMQNFYHIMDVSVLSSLTEGLSITLLESLKYGIPVVATNVGGNSEIIKQNVNGYLVPPKDPIALAEKIVFLLKNSEVRQQMAMKGHAILKEKFDIDNTVKNYQNIYQEVLSSHQATEQPNNFNL